jgi:uncharacterized membrane protein YjjB (DUF3815 family)
MMSYFFAFLTSAAITLSFRGRPRAVPGAGAAGMLGYVVYDICVRVQGSQVLGVFLGALAVGTAGELLARRLREPNLVFVVPALFPLVPGIMAYGGMLNLARGEMSAAVHDLTKTLFYAGALAAGLSLPPAFLRRRRQK